MTPDERLRALERAVAELSDKLDPQTLRNALEFTMNPRGLADEVRVLDPDGSQLPLRRRLHFVGLTAVDDPLNKRTVITGGGGTALAFPSGIDPLVHYDAAALPLVNGDPVTSWTDLGTGSHHATQSNAAKQPTFATGSQNGLPMVSFDGTDDVLQSAVFATIVAPFEVYAVVKFRNSTQQRTALDGQAGGMFLRQDFPLSPFSAGMGDSVNALYRLYDVAGTQPAAVAAHLHHCRFNTAGRYLIDGGTTNSGASPDTANLASGTAPGGVTLGCNRLLSSFADVLIGEVIVTVGLSGSAQAAMLTYLRDKWATP